MKIKELFENSSNKNDSIKSLGIGHFGQEISPNGKTLDEWNGPLSVDERGLDSLEGCPLHIKGGFSCSHNNLKTLEFGPLSVNGLYDCSNNLLETLKGCPEEVGSSKMSFAFDCSNNKLTSLENGPKKVIGTFSCEDNPIKSFKDVYKHIHEIDGTIYLPLEVESNILGLLKIKNLKKIAFFNDKKSLKHARLKNIINKYLPNPTPAQIIDCQNELIDADLEEYAEL